MRTCTVCHHNERDEINKSLIAGEPLRKISQHSGTSVTALFRHKKDHLPATLAVAKQAAAEIQGDSLYSRLRLVNQQTATILQEALASKSLNLALAAIARIEKQIELEAKLIGELNGSKPQVHPDNTIDLCDERALLALTPQERLLLHGIVIKMQAAIRLRLKEGEVIETTVREES